MGFLDNLKDKAEEFGEKAKEGFEAAKDKASDLVGDVKDRLDKDDETSMNTTEAATNYSPGAVDEASMGTDDAVAESTAAAESSAADDIGDLPDVPPADPLESAPEAVDPVLEPSTSTDTNDPLESAPDRTG
jgi:hypothetical protein